jgi:GNAT superfamily N-acetyltransferase
MKNSINFCSHILNIFYVFNRYGVDTCLEGSGMSVAAKWRGKGVGQILIKGRDALCRALGIAVQKTVFSAIQSQKVALKGGFELLGEMNYADLKLPNGDPCFPNMHPDQQKIQLMAKRLL